MRGTHSLTHTHTHTHTHPLSSGLVVSGLGGAPCPLRRQAARGCPLHPLLPVHRSLGVGFRSKGLGFRVEGAGCRVQGARFGLWILVLVLGVVVLV